MWNGASGITLVELIVVVAISSIILAAATPTLHNIVRDNRLSASVNALSGTLAVARSEAVTRSARVVVCKSRTGTACSSDGGWERGWFVFEDLGGSGKCTDADDDQHCDEHGGAIIRVHPGLSVRDLALTGTGNLKNKVAFNARGFATGYAGTFTACDERGEDFAHGIVLSLIGRPRLADWAIDTPTCRKPEG